MANKIINKLRQKGQAAVLVNLFLLIMVVAGLGMYKSGKLTTDKMQLQNAADAAAYSMALTEARDLNFAAYMNRAIVANEVAVGQLVGLASWAFHWYSFGEFLDSYNTLFLAPITLGASTAVVTPITSAWKSVGQVGINILSKVANIGTTVLHNINKIYGLAEYGYHTVSVVFAIGVLNDVIDQNAPPDSKISDFGFIGLIAHIATYGGLPGLPGDQFSTSYSPTASIPVDEFEDSGYARLSGLIRDSRDPFTRGRGWELRPPGFPIDFETSYEAGIDIGVASVSFGFEISFHIDMSLERKGASELRIILPSSGNTSGQDFNWSSADTTGLFFELAAAIRLWAEACVVIVGCAGVSIGGGFDVSNSQVTVFVEVLGKEIKIIDGWPFPTSAPFSAGFAQAGKGDGKINVDDLLLASLGGDIETDHYGEAANNMLAWISPGPVPPTPTGIQQFPLFKPASHVNKTYNGLPRYVDTTGNESFLGIGAPNILIGLVLDEEDFDQNSAGTGTEREPTGNFELTEGLADDEIAVISKAELYFSRPLDVSHFARADGQTEHGNGFNPYWNARLVDTEYPDRVLALFIQQKQNFVDLGDSFDAVFGDIMDYLP